MSPYKVGMGLERFLRTDPEPLSRGLFPKGRTQGSVCSKNESGQVRSGKIYNYQFKEEKCHFV
jgi:hypothetical protein